MYVLHWRVKDCGSRASILTILLCATIFLFSNFKPRYLNTSQQAYIYENNVTFPCGFGGINKCGKLQFLNK